MTPPTISNEHAVPWTPAAEMRPPWNVEVQTQHYIGASRLVLEVEITSLVERTVERWHLGFAGVAAFRQEAVGFPANPLLTRFEWSRQYHPHNAALRVIENSEWLSTCRTSEREPESLTHFVVYEHQRRRVWHIAAESCHARRGAAGERLGATDYPLLVDAAVAYQAGRTV